MIPGLSGTHTWSDAVTLNDLAVWPRYRLRRIPGLHTRPDQDGQNDQPAGRRFEISRRALLRGKNIVYEGSIEALSFVQLEQARDELLAAFADPDGRMDVASMLGDEAYRPDPTQPGSVGNPQTARRSYFYTARCTALDVPEEQPDPAALRRQTRGYERVFTIGLHLSDPRYYSTPHVSAQTAAVAVQSGRPLPWVLPVSLPAPGTASGTVLVTNDGTAPADPVFEMWGPAPNPAIANDTLGVELGLNLQIAAGQFVRIDFRDRSVLLGGVEDVHNAIDPDRASWWDGDQIGLRPGPNALRYVAAGLADPAHALADFDPAWWS